MSPLALHHCTPVKGLPLAATEAAVHLAGLPGWTVDGVVLEKTFSFPDFHRTMAFVNAVAWIAHVEDHHPDLRVSHGRCTVSWSTHSVGGLSINDFICAAKVDALQA